MVPARISSNGMDQPRPNPDFPSSKAHVLLFIAVGIGELSVCGPRSGPAVVATIASPALPTKMIG
jgi:hypothetical protein